MSTEDSNACKRILKTNGKMNKTWKCIIILWQHWVQYDYKYDIAAAYTCHACLIPHKITLGQNQLYILGYQNQIGLQTFFFKLFICAHLRSILPNSWFWRLSPMNFSFSGHPCSPPFSKCRDGGTSPLRLSVVQSLHLSVPPWFLGFLATFIWAMCSCHVG